MPAPTESNPDHSTQEWLLTNATGGFSMGSRLGPPARRYHALLVAADRPPADRWVAINILHETLVLPDGRRLHPTPIEFSDREHDSPGFETNFGRLDAGVRWSWSYANGDKAILLTKELALHPDRPELSARYSLTSPVPVTLEVRPLVSMRRFHDLATDKHLDRIRDHHDGKTTACTLGDRTLRLISDHPLTPEPERWRDLRYRVESDRGMPDTEHLHAPGRWSIDATSAQLNITATAADTPPIDQDAALVAHQQSLASFSGALQDTCRGERPEVLSALALAADQFVVHRETPPGPSIIAGYPWFSDWGRDSMISLPGLLLCTGRHDEANELLTVYAAARTDGLIPNRFDDDDGPPHYNTVDASLWFVHACVQTLHATGDDATFHCRLLPACLDVLDAYRTGTRFKIGMDDDGLIAAGDETTQLTWMDAQRDGVTFTPRHGKAVEINALWIHALRSIAPHAPERAKELLALADQASVSFRALFLTGRGLIDCVSPDADGRWIPDARVRPNQVIAASLEHAPLAQAERATISALADEELLTPMGLRTLAPGEPGYLGRYKGPLFDRDAAYHNGTVWPWLIGPLVETHLRAHSFSPESRERARGWITPLINQFESGACPGQLCEVSDGDEPQIPDGCPAQAWSVAELIRTIVLISTPR